MWFKRMLSPLNKTENSPVFRFFMDLNDAGIAVSNVSSSLLDAYGLSSYLISVQTRAYEWYTHLILFQFSYFSRLNQTLSCM